jgi:hypothetical protein
MMESEQSQNFNERLSQWVASQGFWFQLRYSLGGGSGMGTITYHLLRMGSRLLVLLLIVAVGGGIYLANRTSGTAFLEQAQSSLSAALGATESKLGGVTRSGGELNINRLASAGGSETFFTTLQARMVSARMGLLAGVYGTWDPGTVSINQLDVHLNTGAETAEASAGMARLLFQNHEGFSLNSIRVNNATIRWGEVDRGSGAIEGSQAQIQRVPNGWRLEFEGGQFTHGWLRQMEIVRLTIVLTPDGLRFETAEFRQGRGTVNLSGLTVAGGPEPQVSGLAVIRRLPLTPSLPLAARDFMDGSISAELRVSGSTNTVEGIGFEGEVKLEGADSIAIRDRVHLLRALTVVDAFQTYRTVDFREGGFNLKTGGGIIELTNLDLKAGDLVHLRGAVTIRTFDGGGQSGPAAVGTGAAPTIVSRGDDLFRFGERATNRFEGFGVSAESGDRPLLAGGPAAADLFDRVSSDVEFRSRADEALALAPRLLMFDGNLRVSLSADSFDRAEALKRAHPVDPVTGRIPFDVPLRGNLFDLTLDQAEDFYMRGRR